MSPVEALRLNASETFLALASALEKTEIFRTPHYWLCFNPINHPLANFAIHLDLNEERLRELLHHAKEKPNFRIYVLPGDSPDDLVSRLTHQGLSTASLLVGMYLRHSPANPPTVARLARSDELLQVSEFIVRNFFWHFPSSLRQAVRDALARVQDVPHHFYVSTVESQIVAVGTLTFTKGTAGLYNVCVHPRHRNRGLGSALVRQLSAWATQNHVPLVLLCEPELKIWYQSLGFEEIGESRAFLWLPPLA